MTAGPDAGWRVALRIVLHGPGHVTPQLRQIGRQLQHSVDGSDVHLTCPLVDGQVRERGVEGPVHHSARRHGGRWGSSRGREEGGGEEDEGEEMEEGQRRGGDHGGQKEEEERMKGKMRRGGEEEEERRAGSRSDEESASVGHGCREKKAFRIEDIHTFRLSLVLQYFSD